MVFQVNYFSPFCGWWRMGIYKHTVRHGIEGQGVITTLYTVMSFDVVGIKVGITLASVQPHFQGSLSSSFERRENPGNDVGFSLNVVALYMRYFLGVRETNRYFLLRYCTRFCFYS